VGDLEQDGGQFSGLVAVERVALAEVEDIDVRSFDPAIVDAAVSPLNRAGRHLETVIGDLAVCGDDDAVRLKIIGLPRRVQCSSAGRQRDIGERVGCGGHGANPSVVPPGKLLHVNCTTAAVSQRKRL
jgi:hypothetical protein